jgi:redox-sensitive bicupin YhaK (pirin superfamily)
MAKITFIFFFRNFIKTKGYIMANKILHTANTRGEANHGWLHTFHTFSFANYYDPKRVHFGKIRVLNDDTVKGGYGFGKHPHDNMEIITIVLEGALEHKDSMGHTQAIHAGEVQVMSAGTGIQHSEYNHDPNKDVKLFQIWIFPDEEDVTPRYDQRIFPAEERVNKLQCLVSPINSSDEGLKIHQQAWIYRITLEKGHDLAYALHHKNSGVYTLLIDGKINAEGEELNNRDGLGISDTDAIEIKANETSDILLLEVPMA